MFPNKSDYWILLGSNQFRWMFFKSFQLLISLRNNQKMGMVANWESKGKLLRKGLEKIGIVEKEKDLRYII